MSRVDSAAGRSVSLRGDQYIARQNRIFSFGKIRRSVEKVTMYASFKKRPAREQPGFRALSD
jgi:hypothetical protein